MNCRHHDAKTGSVVHKEKNRVRVTTTIHASVPRRNKKKKSSVMPSRGPRPRLDHLRHPVTRQTLMDEITEHSRSVFSEDESTMDDDDDDDGWSASQWTTDSASQGESLLNADAPRSEQRDSHCQNPRPPPRNKPTSPFAKLSTEIVQFQVRTLLLTPL
jgi:hypothetical protein